MLATYSIISLRSTKQRSISLSLSNYFKIIINWSFLSACMSSYSLPSLSYGLRFLIDNGKHEVPGKRILLGGWLTILLDPVTVSNCWSRLPGLSFWNSSKSVQPRLHMSWALSYCFWIRTSSGARYHLVPVLSERNRYFSLNIFVFYITFLQISLLRLSCTLLFLAC